MRVLKSTVFFCLLISQVQSFCQRAERHWEDGILTWDDFRGEPPRLAMHGSELHYQITYSTGKLRFSDSALYVFITTNYMDPSLSWVKPEDRTDQLLKYNQALFNLTELHRRELQSELHRLENPFLAGERLRIQYEALNQEVRRLQEGTAYGADADAVDYWYVRIEDELKKHPYERVPVIKDRNFGYGMNAGFGTGRLTNELSDHFSGTFNFMYGFDIAFKKTVVFLNATLAGNKVKSAFEGPGGLWHTNMRTSAAMLDLSAGYPLVENSKHKLTPFLGFGFLELAASNNKNDQYKDHRLNDTGIIYGLNYDFKFRKAVRLTPNIYFPKMKEKVENNIRVRLYILSGEFGDFRGTSVNVTVGYALFGRLLKIN